MTALFHKVLTLGWRAGLLALAVMLIRCLLAKRLPKWSLCLLWLLVALRLIVPFSFRSSFSLMTEQVGGSTAIDSWANSYVGETHIYHTNTPEYQEAISAGLSPVINQADINDIESVYVVTGETTTKAPATVRTSIYPILTGIWLAGIGIMLCYFVISYLRIWRQVKHSRWDCGIYYSKNIRSPFVLGLVHPRIFLPENLDEEKIPLILAHEQAHIDRLDFLWKPLAFLLLSVYWFNPILWLAYILLNRDIESACDERVFKNMSKSQRAAYSRALVACATKEKWVSACPVAFGENGVSARVKNILSYKKPSFWMILLALLVTVFLSIGFLTKPTEMPVYSLGNISFGELSRMEHYDLQSNQGGVSHWCDENNAPHTSIVNEFTELQITELMEMLSDLRFRGDVRSLLPWEITSYRDKAGSVRAELFLVLEPGTRYCDITLSSSGLVTVSTEENSGQFFYRLTTPEAVEPLVAYIKSVSEEREIEEVDWAPEKTELMEVYPRYYLTLGADNAECIEVDMGNIIHRIRKDEGFQKGETVCIEQLSGQESIENATLSVLSKAGDILWTIKLNYTDGTVGSVSEDDWKFQKFQWIPQVESEYLPPLLASKNAPYAIDAVLNYGAITLRHVKADGSLTASMQLPDGKDTLAEILKDYSWQLREEGKFEPGEEYLNLTVSSEGKSYTLLIGRHVMKLYRGEILHCIWTWNSSDATVQSACERISAYMDQLETQSTVSTEPKKDWYVGPVLLTAWQLENEQEWLKEVYHADFSNCEPGYLYGINRESELVKLLDVQVTDIYSAKETNLFSKPAYITTADGRFCRFEVQDELVLETLYSAQYGTCDQLVVTFGTWKDSLERPSLGFLDGEHIMLYHFEDGTTTDMGYFPDISSFAIISEREVVWDDSEQNTYYRDLDTDEDVFWTNRLGNDWVTVRTHDLLTTKAEIPGSVVLWDGFITDSLGMHYEIVSANRKEFLGLFNCSENLIQTSVILDGRTLSYTGLTAAPSDYQESSWMWTGVYSCSENAKVTQIWGNNDLKVTYLTKDGKTRVAVMPRIKTPSTTGKQPLNALEEIYTQNLMDAYLCGDLSMAVLETADGYYFADLNTNEVQPLHEKTGMILPEKMENILFPDNSHLLFAIREKKAGTVSVYCLDLESGEVFKTVDSEKLSLFGTPSAIKEENGQIAVVELTTGAVTKLDIAYDQLREASPLGRDFLLYFEDGSLEQYQCKTGIVKYLAKVVQQKQNQ